jgi:uncharacterized membrane protein YfcA
MEQLSSHFIELDLPGVVFLLMVGFIGGLVSGFIGSGGAFVLTPGMMSMGVPGVVAVASNMCHKFPKALVGAYKRHKYGHVHVKLGLFMAGTAAIGVWAGAMIQQGIKANHGEAGSSLYVSVAFVIVLVIVGAWVLRDAYKIYRQGAGYVEQLGRLARWVQSVEIPGTMVEFKVAKIRVSLLFIVPLGFATGMLAATIAVGGFIGVPGMIYLLGAPSLVASATELVVAFVMGMVGTISYAMHGFVDIRLAMIILAGSLFGIQLGAIGTTYVKPYMIKVVMGAIMMIVAVSRAVVIPVYLAELGKLELSAKLMELLKDASFLFMVGALLTGAIIIVGAMIRGHRDHTLSEAEEEPVPE